MPTLRDKTILIVSPQSWGKMFVSKHHYAVELARYGNKVYFLNPPETNVGQDPAEKIRIEPNPAAPNLFVIHHRLSFPYNIKFHWPGLFHWLMRPHIAAILRKIGSPVDIIWSFDLGDLYPFRLFPSRAFRIFHPVDEPLNDTAIRSGKGGQVIFSVTKEILDKYRQFPAPAHFINHGLSREFIRDIDTARGVGHPIRVGLSGNFLRGDIDRPVLLQIIRENPAVIFECWGSYKTSQSNIAGSSDTATHDFIETLAAQPNVRLHGAIPAQELAGRMLEVDAFLICYDILKDQSGGTNYHKIMEYFGTGKLVVSNNVTTYKDRSDLLLMTEERDHNRKLPELFAQAMSRLHVHNSPENQQTRIAFARNNTYRQQIERIEKIINDL